MGMVAIDNLEPGMCVASDVHDLTGRLLLGAGAEITNKHLIIFRAWGVEEVDIVGAAPQDLSGQLPPNVTSEELNAAEDALKPLFRHAGLDHPAVRELLRLAALKKAQDEKP